MVCNSLQDIALLIYFRIRWQANQTVPVTGQFDSVMLHDRLLFFKWCTISKTCRGILREVCLFLQMAPCKVIILQCFPTGSWLIQDIFLYTHTHLRTEQIMSSFCMLCLEKAQQLQVPMVPSGVCPQSASQQQSRRECLCCNWNAEQWETSSGS